MKINRTDSLRKSRFDHTKGCPKLESIHPVMGNASLRLSFANTSTDCTPNFKSSGSSRTIGFDHYRDGSSSVGLGKLEVKIHGVRLQGTRRRTIQLITPVGVSSIEMRHTSPFSTRTLPWPSISRRGTAGYSEFFGLSPTWKISKDEIVWPNPSLSEVRSPPAPSIGSATIPVSPRLSREVPF